MNKEQLSRAAVRRSFTNVPVTTDNCKDGEATDILVDHNNSDANR